MRAIPSLQADIQDPQLRLALSAIRNNLNGNSKLSIPSITGLNDVQLRQFLSSARNNINGVKTGMPSVPANIEDPESKNTLSAIGERIRA